MRTAMSGDWGAFERDVALAYERLGYKIEQDVDVAGQQIDILASKIVSGYGKLCIAIECKYKSKGKSGNQEVYEFSAQVAHLKKVGSVTGGCLVASNGFTRQAKKAVEADRTIELLTYTQLQEQVFGVQASMQDYAVQYEKSLIYSSYIPLSATKGAGRIANVEEFSLNWLTKSKPGSLCCVLGDFGVGKTTLIERIKHRLAKRYLHAEAQLKPIVFRLRNYHRAGTLDGLIRMALREEFSQDVPLPFFWALAESGEFAFLLDGFDEMAKKSDAATRIGHMMVLAPLLSTHSRSILTCRPSFFTSSEELNGAIGAILDDAEGRERSGTDAELSAPHVYSDTEMRRAEARQNKSIRARKRMYSRQIRGGVGPSVRQVDYTVLHINPYSAEQIQAFLQKHDAQFRDACGEGWQDIYSFLQDVYDLSDLMKRPILMDMIVDTILSGALDPTDKAQSLGPYDVYSMYTDVKLVREEQSVPGRDLLNRQMRTLFAQALAITMFDRERLEVEYAEIVQEVERSKECLAGLADVLQTATVEEVAGDVQTCTFLSRGDDGLFRFAHKSFMEFYVARYIVQQISSLMVEPRLQLPMPREIVYFLGSAVGSSPDLYRELRSLLAKSVGQQERQNISSALVYAAPFLDGLHLSGTRVANVEMGRQRMSNIHLGDVHLSCCSFDGIEFNDSHVSGEVEESEFFKVHANNTSLSARMVKAALSSCQWAGGGFAARSQGLVLQDVAFSGNAVKVVGDCSVVSTTFTSCSSVHLEGCVIDAAKFNSLGDLRLEGSQLAGCELEGLDLLEASRTSFDGCLSTDVGIAVLEKCTLERGSLVSVKLSMGDCSLVNSELVVSPVNRIHLYKGKNRYFESGIFGGHVIFDEKARQMRISDERLPRCWGVVFYEYVPTKKEIEEIRALQSGATEAEAKHLLLERMRDTGPRRCVFDLAKDRNGLPLLALPSWAMDKDYRADIESMLTSAGDVSFRQRVEIMLDLMDRPPS